MKEKIKLCLGLIVLTILIITSLINMYADTLPKTVLSFETEVRAYCAGDCCTNGDGITASSGIATGKFIASSLFDFNTFLEVPGYGVHPVLDRGPEVVEVFINNHEDALEWGVQKLRVKVIQ
jgi:3D (Asp-Asp-Asp) domain-containing protein